VGTYEKTPFYRQEKSPTVKAGLWVDGGGGGNRTDAANSTRQKGFTFFLSRYLL